MFHLVALHRKLVVKSANDAVLAAIYNWPLFNYWFLIVKVELRTKLVRVNCILTNGVVKFDDFFELVLAWLAGIPVDYFSYLDVFRFRFVS